MDSHLLKSIRDRTGRAYDYIGEIETRLNQIVPELETVQNRAGKSSPKLEAVILTLNEVSGLVKEIKGEIEAGDAHFAEGLESLQDVRNQVVKARHESAQTATLTRHLNYFLTDWIQLRLLLLGVIKERPELKEQIREWLKEDAPDE